MTVPLRAKSKVDLNDWITAIRAFQTNAVTSEQNYSKIKKSISANSHQPVKEVSMKKKKKGGMFGIFKKKSK